MTKVGFFKRLKALNVQQKKLFAVALCQRMLPNYQLFAEVSEFGNAAVLDTLLQLLWQSLYDNKLKLNIEAQLLKLEENTPEPEDFDMYGVYPALDAVVALTTYLGAIQGKIEEDLTNISKLSSSTVASYVETLLGEDFSTAEKLEDAVFQHPVMQQEQELQLSLLEIVEDNPTLDADFIKALRKELVMDGVSNIGISLT